MKHRAPIVILSCCVVAFLCNLPARGAWSPVVDRLTDGNPYGGGEGSMLRGDLRYAMSNALPGDTVTFSVTGTIILNASLPSVRGGITIQGPGANLLTVNGGGNTVFYGYGDGGVISGLTVTGGYSARGGGIANSGTLTLNGVTISGNTARYDGDPNDAAGHGGGILNGNNGTLTMNGCTVNGNHAEGNDYNYAFGGGICNMGTLTLTNCTVFGNWTNWRGFGGGILNYGTLTVDNSTISGNDPFISFGSGIYNYSSCSLRNTIVAGNGGSFSDIVGNVSSQGHNLIGTTNNSSGYRPDLGDLLNVNPNVTSFQYNGGSTKTLAPMPGSPAVDHGDNAGAPPYDQRGPGFSRVVNGTVDIGAIELQEGSYPAVVGDSLKLSKSDTVITLTWMGSCSGSATDYEIYEGAMGSWYSHTAKVCSDASHDLAETFTPDAENSYYLVVPRNGLGEGSYGLASNGVQRPVGATQCATPQVLAGCQ